MDLGGRHWLLGALDKVSKFQVMTDLGHLGDLGFNSFLGCSYCHLLCDLFVMPCEIFFVLVRVCVLAAILGLTFSSMLSKNGACMQT